MLVGAVAPPPKGAGLSCSVCAAKRAGPGPGPGLPASKPQPPFTDFYEYHSPTPLEGAINCLSTGGTLEILRSQVPPSSPPLRGECNQ
ncbi:hypothetical protein EYF80_036526 [Liparis tanakae]|uniref:Uncharacterized protein n=1 Tax=Liparis tanakae TaxID=230148 RepID=A0A4Z2GKS0_9TELE|nr:hypothetical protein EYF80_036526 [Liparis tanakae]